MYLTIVFLPLISSIIAGLFGRHLGVKGVCIITVSGLLFTLVLSIVAFYEVALSGSPVYIKLIPWVDSELFNVDWGFLFDTLTVLMCCVVTFVSFLVHLYSTEYMACDPHLPRFMSYLSLFTFFMLILVTADNYVQMFVGWEGVGLCSYLLINFWFTRIQANKAAITAMIVNRIGDFGLALGILTIFVKFQSVDYATLFAITPTFVGQTFTFLNFEFDLLTVIGTLLFVGSVGKSAQIGLHTWLPDAMEGPTPVSALIHAATMVTAGVFLLARSSPLFEYAPNTLLIIVIIGSVTAFFAATTGILQNDLKRVIAYSTCSQLGYMIFACGLSNYSVGIFHLSNHAFFKALLFLGAGSVIHSVADEQDMRKMGGLRKLVPFTYSVMMVGSLALMGFPFLTGFYSKDVILEVAYGKFTKSGHFAYFLGTSAAFFTAFYSIRLIYLTFLSEPNGYRPILIKAHDSPIKMALPLAILVVPSIFFGYLTKDMIIGVGTDFWGNSIYVLPKNMNIIDAEFIPQIWKLLPLIVSAFGAGLSFLMYALSTDSLYQVKMSFTGRKIYNFLSKKWFFDKVFSEYITQSVLLFGYHISYKALDRGIIEILGPMGLSNLISKKSFYLQRLQTGFLYHYAFSMLLGVTLLIGLLQLWNSSFIVLDFRVLSTFIVATFFFPTFFNLTQKIR
jgi:NADH-ubiquinone oxidoreductase chain 5